MAERRSMVDGRRSVVDCRPPTADCRLPTADCRLQFYEVTMKDYKELDVWQRSIRLVVAVYGLLRDFPPEERFGLADQIKRSAVSIPSNIAEGAGRHGSKEFAKFLTIACGSSNELETQLIIAQKLGVAAAVDAILAELFIIRKQLHAFINSLRSNCEK